MEISLNGSDVININGTLQRDFADGDVGVLTLPNELVQMKPGKNGNTVIAFSATGQLGELTLRFIRGSFNDQYINAQYRAFVFDPASYVTMEAVVTKQIGDGNGNITSDSYNLTGGVIQSIPEVKSNVEGDTDQGVTIWKLRFAKVERQVSSSTVSLAV